MNDSDLLLLLAAVSISSGTFWWNYVSYSAGRNFGRSAESGAFIGCLAIAASLPLLSAAILTLALAAPLGSVGRVLLLAALLQGQWVSSRQLFAHALRLQKD